MLAVCLRSFHFNNTVPELSGFSLAISFCSSRIKCRWADGCCWKVIVVSIETCRQRCAWRPVNLAVLVRPSCATNDRSDIITLINQPVITTLSCMMCASWTLKCYTVDRIIGVLQQCIPILGTATALSASESSDFMVLNEFILTHLHWNAFLLTLFFQWFSLFHEISTIQYDWQGFNCASQYMQECPPARIFIAIIVVIIIADIKQLQSKSCIKSLMH